MSHCVDGFSPKLLRDILVEENHLSHFLNNTILSFNNPILLRCLWSRKFLLDPILTAKGFELCILKFLPMITSYFGNGNPFFILKPLTKFLHLLTCFRLFSKKVHSRVSKKIINNDHDVSLATQTFSPCGTH